jgi:hypothetical protein
MSNQSRHEDPNPGLGRGRDASTRTRALGDGVLAAALLDVMPELGEHLQPADWSQARRRSLVQVEPFAVGIWTPHLTSRNGRPHTGLLVTDGLLVREVEMGGRTFAELLGAGDLIYPWAPSTGASAPEGQWRVLVAGKLAVIDELLVARLSPYPQVTLAMARLATMRGRFLAALTITRRLRRVESRLIFLFELLAERWGRVTADGIVVRLPLNHELLGRLVGTRRQAVTSALGPLRERRRLTQLTDGWLLGADLPPAPGTNSIPGV